MTIRLVGAAEIRAMMAPIAKRRFCKLARRPHFPAPAARLAQGRVWDCDEVEAWLAEHRTPG